MTRVSCVLVAALAACGGDDGGGASPIDGVPSTLINPYKVWAFSPTNVWILDGTATVHRFDGSEWSQLMTPSTGGLACIYALSETDVWLCAGDDVLHYDGAAFTASDVAGPTGLDGLSAIWASAANDVWVVGDDAIVAHYTGSAWQRSIVGSPFKSSIWGTSPSNVYALSTFDLSHFDGLSWTEIELDGTPAGGDGQVWGTSASDVWLMNGDDMAWHYDGSAWTPSSELVADLSAVWGTGPDQIWAGGSFGYLARYDGSWHTLASQTPGSPYLRTITSVHGSSATNVWAVGRQLGEVNQGLIYKLQ